MKQKRRKLSMKVKDGLGPACPTCALPMQRWKHDPKWKPPARYYAYWYECLSAACNTKQVMPPKANAGTRGLDAKQTMARQEIVAPRRGGRPDIAAHATNLSAE